MFSEFKNKCSTLTADAQKFILIYWGMTDLCLMLFFFLVMALIFSQIHLFNKISCNFKWTFQFWMLEKNNVRFECMLGNDHKQHADSSS